MLSTAGRNILRGRVFDENFLMSIATLGAIAIHELPEAVAVMLFFQVGELFQDYSVGRSRRSIKSLLEVRPDTANLKVDGDIREVSPESVSVDDVILVRPGEKVPLDGEILEGKSQMDTSALTGESVPRSVAVGETVLSGMINQSGVLTVRVTKPFNESSISRILELVENASAKKLTPKSLLPVLPATTRQLWSFSRWRSPFCRLVVPDALAQSGYTAPWYCLSSLAPAALSSAFPWATLAGLAAQPNAAFWSKALHSSMPLRRSIRLSSTRQGR